MDGGSSGRCDLESILVDPDSQPGDIPLQYLRDITDNFSPKEEIGRGGFGVVYKGVLPNGAMIAVKNLVVTSGFEEKQFQNEVNNLMRVRHQNIVRFVGYCYEARKKRMNYNGKYVFAETPKLLLCFEYMPKASLDKYISDAPCGFDWPKCYKIIEGICHGLNYLHEECQTDASIVHLDLKPANILLDENMVPKIADFGLSKFFADKKTQTLASIPAGSVGYMAPEYLFRRIITTKADIYSLGVIIIEMITGQRFSPVDIVDVESALEHWRNRLEAELMHTSVEIYCKQIKGCLDIGFSCVNRNRSERPTTREIIKWLNSLQSINCDVSDVERPAADKFMSDQKEHRCPVKSAGAAAAEWQGFDDDAFGDGPADHDYEGRLDDEPREEMAESNSSLPSILPKKLPASFLREITDNFSAGRVLGNGAFGTVYKGILQNGEVIVVKLLGEDSPVSHEKILQNEVGILMAAQHENIVKLVGFSHELQKKVVEHNGKYIIVDIAETMLCYEFLPKGSLDKYLFDYDRIDWDTWFKIIKGISNGLHFLHKEMDNPVVHMNLTPNNILLDNNMVPKIADFGFSRLFGQKQTRAYTLNVVAAFDYMAPEYLYSGEISTHADIYGLGLLIIQISTGEKNTPNIADKCGRKYIEKVQQNWTDNRITSMYASLDANRLQQIKTCIEIGLQCVETDRRKRPSIMEIVNKLNGSSAC